MRYRILLDFDLDPPEGAAMTMTTALRLCLPPSVENKAVAIAISDGVTIECIKDREGKGDLMTAPVPGNGKILPMEELLKMTAAAANRNRP